MRLVDAVALAALLVVASASAVAAYYAWLAAASVAASHSPCVVLGLGAGNHSVDNATLACLPGGGWWYTNASRSFGWPGPGEPRVLP